MSHDFSMILLQNKLLFQLIQIILVGADVLVCVCVVFKWKERLALTWCHDVLIWMMFEFSITNYIAYHIHIDKRHLGWGLSRTIKGQTCQTI